MTTSGSATSPIADLLSSHSAGWLLRWARARLTGVAPAESLGAPPASVKTPRDVTVFLTIYRGGATASFRGQGGDLLDAVALAVQTVPVLRRPLDRLQLDIVRGMAQPLARPADGERPRERANRALWQRLTSFQDGLVVGRGETAYWLVASQLLLQSMARRRRDVDPARPADILAAAMRGIGWSEDAWQDDEVELWSFQTDSWIEDASHARALPLVQGVILPGGGVSRARLTESAIAAGEYLLQVQREDGSFQYTVDPWLRTRSRTAYNILRHSGTTACLFELHAATGDTRFLEAANQGVKYQSGWYRPGAQPELTYVLDHDGKGKLGALGLALLALTRKHECDPAHADRDQAVALARQIVAMQHADGSFESYLPLKGTEQAGSVSLYYPGEAMLGLARLRRLGLDDNRIFVHAAHCGADFLIESRRGKDRLPPDAWLIQALNVLYDDEPKASYVEHALAISRSMLRDQYGEDAPPAYVGSFGPEPMRSTRTTARVEGLIAAYRLARKAGDGGATDLLDAMLRTVPPLLQLQYSPDTSFFLARPERALGGMRGGLDDAEIRIDYVQHHISAMLGLAALLSE